MAQAEAGKGSKPRNQQNHDAYASGYDRIFGNRAKNNQEKEVVMDAKSIVIAAYKAFVSADDEENGDDGFSDSGLTSFVGDVIPESRKLLPLNEKAEDEVTVEVSGSSWFPVKYCMHDGYFICIVQSEGGGEGEGEYVSRVFGVFKIINHTFYEGCTENFKVTVDYSSGQFCELNGSYYSYDGTTWDDITNMVNVKPKIVPTVIFEDA